MTKEEIRDHADKSAKKSNVNGDNIHQSELEKQKQLDKMKADKIKQGLKNAIAAQKKKSKRKLKGKTIKKKTRSKKGKVTTAKGKSKTGKGGGGGGGDDDGGDPPDPPDPKDFPLPEKPTKSINDELRQLVLNMSKVPKAKKEEYWRGFPSKAVYKKLASELK